MPYKKSNKTIQDTAFKLKSGNKPSPAKFFNISRSPLMPLGGTGSRADLRRLAYRKAMMQQGGYNVSYQKDEETGGVETNVSLPLQSMSAQSARIMAYYKKNPNEKSPRERRQMNPWKGRYVNRGSQEDTNLELTKEENYGQNY